MANEMIRTVAMNVTQIPKFAAENKINRNAPPRTIKVPKHLLKNTEIFFRSEGLSSEPNFVFFYQNR